MKKLMWLAGLAVFAFEYCAAQNETGQKEKDTLITTVSARNGSVQLRADVLPDYIYFQWSKGIDDFTGYFELYRSADGTAYNIIRQFHPKTFDDQENYYSFKDEEPLKGKNYYRLIGYDKFTQEKRTIDIVTDFKNLPRKIQPTILTRGNQLNITHYNGEELVLWIYTSAGTPIIQKIVASGVVDLTTNLSKGLYIYQLLNKKNEFIVSSGKFVLQ